MKYLKDEAVEAILQEAAEAFAIERAKKEIGYSVPTIEEIARACDPVGVMDVIDAFNLNSCDDTEIEDFPACTDSTTYFHQAEEIDAMLEAEEVRVSVLSFLPFTSNYTNKFCCRNPLSRTVALATTSQLINTSRDGDIAM